MKAVRTLTAIAGILTVAVFGIAAEARAGCIPKQDAWRISRESNEYILAEGKSEKFGNVLWLGNPDGSSWKQIRFPFVGEIASSEPQNFYCLEDWGKRWVLPSGNEHAKIVFMLRELGDEGELVIAFVSSKLGPLALTIDRGSGRWTEYILLLFPNENTGEQDVGLVAHYDGGEKWKDYLWNQRNGGNR